MRPALPQSVPALLHDLYAATLTAGGWAGFLATARESLDASTCGFSIARRDGSACRLWLTSGLEASTTDAYDAYFAARNPHTQALCALPIGGVFCNHEHFAPGFVIRNEYYQDFLAPRGLRFNVSVAVAMTETGTIHFGAARGAKRGAFGEREMALIKHVLPHLRRVIESEVQHSSLPFGLHAGVAAGSAERPLVFLAERRQVRGLNGQAEALLKDAAGGPRIAQGVFDTGDADVNAAIDHQLQACNALFRPRRAELMRAPAEFAPLSVVVWDSAGYRYEIFPHPLHKVVWAPDERTVLAVLALDGPPSRRAAHTSPSMSPAVLGLPVTVRLSQAEAEVANALCRGLTLVEIARARGVQRSTVKSQLESLLRKTGARNQKDLVAWLTRHSADER